MGKFKCYLILFFFLSLFVFFQKPVYAQPCGIVSDPIAAGWEEVTISILTYYYSPCGWGACDPGYSCAAEYDGVDFYDVGCRGCRLDLGEQGCALSPDAICKDPDAICYTHPDEYTDGVCTECAGGTNPSSEGASTCYQNPGTVGNPICCNNPGVSAGDPNANPPIPADPEFLKCVNEECIRSDTSFPVCNAYLGNGAPCINDSGGENSCASSKCEVRTNPDTLLPETICVSPDLGASCEPPATKTSDDCVCDPSGSNSGTRSCRDEDGDGDLECAIGEGCVEKDKVCNPISGDPQEQCCEPWYCDDNYDPADSTTGLCGDDPNCIPAYPYDSNDPLYPPAGDYECAVTEDCCKPFSPLGNPSGLKCVEHPNAPGNLVCMFDNDGDTIGDVVNTSPCSNLGGPCGAAAGKDCCPGQNLACIQGTCQDSTTPDPDNPYLVGETCTNEGSCCLASGYKCVTGICVPGYTDCITRVELPSYGGPILHIDEILATIFGFLYPLGIGIGIVFIANAGYCYMTSDGNPEKLKDCAERLTHAILGTLFILLSIAILRVIINSILGESSTLVNF
ncbi:pilin [Patescibacteria group bacterium]